MSHLADFSFPFLQKLKNLWFPVEPEIHWHRLCCVSLDFLSEAS